MAGADADKPLPVDCVPLLIRPRASRPARGDGGLRTQPAGCEPPGSVVGDREPHSPELAGELAAGRVQAGAELLRSGGGDELAPLIRRVRLLMAPPAERHERPRSMTWTRSRSRWSRCFALAIDRRSNLARASNQRHTSWTNKRRWIRPKY